MTTTHPPPLSLLFCDNGVDFWGSAPRLYFTQETCIRLQFARTNLVIRISGEF